MNEKLIKTLELKNGLQLKIYDASRTMAGDRWLVSLIARMEIPVTKVLEKNDSQPKENANEIKDVLGESVVFEQKRDRIFVDIKEKDSVFKEVLDLFLGSSLEYLSRETFPKKFILKAYKEKMKKASLYPDGKNTGWHHHGV
jgi:hypothetical protein